MNLNLWCYLAQVGTQPVTKGLDKGTRWDPPISREAALILGLSVALGLALFVWAFFFRKRRSNEPHRRVLEAGPMSEEGAPMREERSHHGHRRHRHRRTSHTHRNPTLQETGGLPLPRPDDQLPST
jgi:hypothetical protein